MRFALGLALPLPIRTMTWGKEIGRDRQGGVGVGARFARVRVRCYRGFRGQFSPPKAREIVIATNGKPKNTAPTLEISAWGEYKVLSTEKAEDGKRDIKTYGAKIFAPVAQTVSSGDIVCLVTRTGRESFHRLGELVGKVAETHSAKAYDIWSLEPLAKFTK